MPLPNDKVAQSLAALAHHAMSCPFCGTSAENLRADESGPCSVVGDASIEEAIGEAECMTQRVYCANEDRDFAILYRPRNALPECPNCASNFDVVPAPPADHFGLTFDFMAMACCESCGEELGPVPYQAFDIADRGLLGN